MREDRSTNVSKRAAIKAETNRANDEIIILQFYNKHLQSFLDSNLEIVKKILELPRKGRGALAYTGLGIFLTLGLISSPLPLKYPMLWVINAGFTGAAIGSLLVKDSEEQKKNEIYKRKELIINNLLLIDERIDNKNPNQPSSTLIKIKASWEEELNLINRQLKNQVEFENIKKLEEIKPLIHKALFDKKAERILSSPSSIIEATFEQQSNFTDNSEKDEKAELQRDKGI